MKLKVCGMKYNPVEVMALRPDYLGFIFWDGTPRNFTLPKLPDLPTGVQAVGVFVDESIPTLVKRIKSYGLHGVQLHGKESPEYCRELRTKDLDCYLAVMLEVLGQVDGGHAAAADFRLDQVAIRKRSLELFWNVGHRDGSRLATILSYGLPKGRARSS